MKIVKVESTPLHASFSKIFGGLDKVPKSLTFPAASHRVLPRSGQDSNLITVYTNDGHFGIGEAFSLPDAGISKRIVDKVLAPLIIGENPMHIEKLWKRMHDSTRPLGRTRGFVVEAISGVDIALWDLKGKILGQPIYNLLGGMTKERIWCYASPVMYHPTPQMSVEQANKYVGQGFTAIKLKIGRGVNTDLEHIQAVRQSIPPETQLLLDANCGYTLNEALALVDRMNGLDIYWLEEPLRVDDHCGLQVLRQHCPSRLASGENLFSSHDFEPYLINRSLDVIMPNIGRAGGITGCIKLAHLAEHFGLDFSLHGVGSIVNLFASLHILAAVNNSTIYEYNRLLNPLRDELNKRPVVMKGGCLEVPQGSGLGVKLDDDKINEYRLTDI